MPSFGAAAAQPCRQGQIEQQAGTQPTRPPERPRDRGRVSAVKSTEEVRTRVPASMKAEQQRIGEHAMKLAEGIPHVEPGGNLDRRKVDETRPTVHELDVERGGVFERESNL